MKTFDLDPADRQILWNEAINAIEHFYSNTGDLPVSPDLSVNTIKGFINEFVTQKSSDFNEVLMHVIQGMTKYAVHTSHPAYFGLFNPRSNFPGILADTLTAAFNPQLAAWSHAPFAAEVESYLINFFGKKFGFVECDIDGAFTSGGAEANLTALLSALNAAFPEYAQSGLQELSNKPIVYCSAESHHSIVKSVRVAGLGSKAIQTIPVDDNLKLDTIALEEQIRLDKVSGFYPLMIIATAGTTGAGVIDPLAEISCIAAAHQIWFHVDAAYGGGLILSSKADLLSGIEKADSITFDAHKWLSVPMGTSMFISRHSRILSQSFRITAEYMPKEAQSLEVTDPFVHSIQWSRRFNGLKLYMSLLILGEAGYQDTIDKQIGTGMLLRQRLNSNQWQIYNDTELPVICFGHPLFEKNEKAAEQIAERIIKNKKAWISVYPVKGRSALRACITNYNTGEREIDLLISELRFALDSLSDMHD